MEKISVIMSVYNERSNYLRLSIESILNQTHSNIEFIIVNDQPDNSEMSAVLDEYAKKDSRIILLTNEKNMGLVWSLNRALKSVTGEYVARMDGGDISFKARLEIQLAYIKRTDCGLIGSCANWIDENGNVLIHDKGKAYDAETSARLLKHLDFLCHPTWLVKKEVYTLLNGYRDISRAEDDDFLLRAIKKGVRISRSGDVVLDCRDTLDGISHNNHLSQLLTAHFLRKNLDKLEQLTQADIDKYLLNRVTPKEKEKYAKMEMYVDKARAANPNVIKMAYYAVLAMFSSRYFFMKIRTIPTLLGIKPIAE